MARLRRLLARTLTLFRSNRAEKELAREITAHLALMEDEFQTRGMTRDEARRAARRAFGGIEQAKELHRHARSFIWLDDARRDLRYALRLLVKAPGPTAVVVLTLALGIGATTMLFSVAYGVLLKPLPWGDAERLVRITETRQGRTGRVAGTISNGTFIAWRDQSSTLEGLGGWLTQTATLTDAGEPVRVSVIPTTASLFPLLKVRPLIGRLFREGEGRLRDAGVAILSYGLWQERFGGRSDSVGQLVQLDARAYTIVGVMPPDFVFPDRDARVWTAWDVPPVVGGGGVLQGVIFRAIGRLRPDATPAQAAAEGTSRARSAPDLSFAATALFGAVGPIDVSVIPELQAVTADVRPAVLILLAAASLLLITATANVASLQLVRATTRRREMAVRAAIGAGQHRLVKQLLIENVIGGLCGGATGLALAAGLRRLLPTLLPAGFPRLDAVAIDVRVFVFALAVSVGVSIACGLFPAWYTRRLNLIEILSADGAGRVTRPAFLPTGGPRALMMVGQVAIACVLLVGAALFTRSFVSLIRADRGYDPVNVLTARLPLPRGYPIERRSQLLQPLIERLHSVPGVTHAAYSTALPFLSFGGFTAFTMRSPRNPTIEVNIQAAQRIVSPEYFGAMRLRIVAGRALTDADTTTTAPVIVVNRTFAREYLGERPLGFHIPRRGPGAGGIRFADEHADWEVVGVVDDMRQDADAPLQPEIFASVNQVATGTTNVGFDPILVIRTAANPTSYISTLHGLVHEEAPALALDSVMTMEDRIMTSLAKPRLYAVVLAFFAGSALLIAGVGLFGVLSFTVAQRTREIGIRSALGAQVRDIVALVLAQAALIISIGLAVGLATMFASARLLSAFLYGVGPHDPLTFAAVPAVIAVVATVASLVPAHCAAKIDPLNALRSE